MPKNQWDSKVLYWGVCPSCGRERRLKNGVLVLHRKWIAPDVLIGSVYPYGEMIVCYGSGEHPLPELPYLSYAERGEAERRTHDVLLRVGRVYLSAVLPLRL